MFKLEISTDNAAFEGDPSIEISRILGRLGSKLALEPGEEDHGKLHDVNGNTVGTWTYTPSED
jgi:hypothetical protein